MPTVTFAPPHCSETGGVLALHEALVVRLSGASMVPFTVETQAILCRAFEDVVVANLGKQEEVEWLCLAWWCLVGEDARCLWILGLSDVARCAPLTRSVCPLFALPGPVRLVSYR